MVCLGLDVHRNQITVVRQIDGQLPQPAQHFDADGLIRFAARMTGEGCQVHSCYEAGCFGCGLHRRLVEAGVNSRVVVPQNWCGNAKTDKRDAREMCLRLERHVQGNTRALSVIHVPTVEQEARREEGRHRGRLLRERQRTELRGGSLLRKAGHPVPKGWWRPSVWKTLEAALSPDLRAQLAVWQHLALSCETQQAEVRKKLEAQCRGVELPAR